MQRKKQRITCGRVHEILSDKPQTIRQISNRTGISYAHHMVRSRLMILLRSGAAQKIGGKKLRPVLYIRSPELGVAAIKCVREQGNG